MQQKTTPIDGEPEIRMHSAELIHGYSKYVVLWSYQDGYFYYIPESLVGDARRRGATEVVECQTDR